MIESSTVGLNINEANTVGSNKNKVNTVSFKCYKLILEEGGRCKNCGIQRGALDTARWAS